MPLLVVGGLAQLVGAFWTRDWSGFFLSLLMGVLYLVLGVMFLRHPADALAAVTLLLACGLMVSGLFRIIGSLMYRFPHWGWTLLGGAINLLLGIYIYSQWPLDSFIILGLFVGIDMIFTGWTWVMLALAVRDLGRRVASAGGAQHRAPRADPQVGPGPQAKRASPFINRSENILDSRLSIQLVYACLSRSGLAVCERCRLGSSATSSSDWASVSRSTPGEFIMCRY